MKTTHTTNLGGQNPAELHQREKKSMSHALPDVRAAPTHPDPYPYGARLVFRSHSHAGLWRLMMKSS
jgi:hypothetical protein